MAQGDPRSPSAATDAATTSAVNLSLPGSAVVGDTALLVMCQYSFSPITPAGFTDVLTNLSFNSRLKMSIKVLDATDISNGYIAVTPGDSNTISMSLTVLEGEMAYANGATASSTSTAAPGDGATLSTTSTAQRAFGVHGITATANRTLSLTTPPNELANVAADLGTIRAGHVLGYWDPEVASHSVNGTASGGVSRWVYGHLILDPVTPPVDTLPHRRIKRATSAAALSRAVR